MAHNHDGLAVGDHVMVRQAGQTATRCHSQLRYLDDTRLSLDISSDETGELAFICLFWVMSLRRGKTTTQRNGNLRCHKKCGGWGDNKDFVYWPSSDRARHAHSLDTASTIINSPHRIVSVSHIIAQGKLTAKELFHHRMTSDPAS